MLAVSLVESITEVSLAEPLAESAGEDVSRLIDYSKKFERVREENKDWWGSLLAPVSVSEIALAALLAVSEAD